ncbi:ATP-binding protein [Halochromatium sp.]
MDKCSPISRQAAQPTGLRLVGLRAGSRPDDPLLSAEDLAERGRQEVRSLLATRRKALERQWQRQLAASGIPERFRSKGFADYQADIAEQLLARSICQDYACALSAGQRPGETLLLLGGPGTGKTHLACAILATLVRAGQRGWYVSLPSALRSLRDASASRSQGSEADAFAQLSAPDLLVLDDLIDAPQDDHRGVLFEVLDARYAQQRATILIGDLPASRLEHALGPRVIERFHEAGTHQVSFTWPSHRRRAG